MLRLCSEGAGCGGFGGAQVPGRQCGGGGRAKFTSMNDTSGVYACNHFTTTVCMRVSTVTASAAFSGPHCEY